MPRVPSSILRRARSIDPLLPLVLRGCHDISSATRELRWLREGIPDSTPRSSRNRLLKQWCRKRSRGEPLQYILESQPFGALDIKCRTGVLIPRPETETIVEQLCAAVKPLQPKARNAVDFCSGTGCIALFVAKELNINTKGYDISPEALQLAVENVQRNGALLGGRNVSFQALDVLKLSTQEEEEIRERIGFVDVMVSNPPYISPEDFSHGQTTRSVRMYEPKLALVPPGELLFSDIEQADQFYAALLRIAVATNAKVLMMEVGDTQQARRVLTMCQDFGLVRNEAARSIEVWNDDGEVALVSNSSTRQDRITSDSQSHCRAVVLWLNPEWSEQRFRSSTS